MNRTSLALGLAFVLSAGTALAQQDQQYQNPLAQQTQHYQYRNDPIGPTTSDFNAIQNNDFSTSRPQQTYGTANDRASVVPPSQMATSGTGTSTAFLASNLIGRPVTDASGQNLGEVQDLLISNAGQLDGVVLGVGNALGMGEKRVAVGIDSIQPAGDGNGPLISSISRDQLSAAPDFSQQPMILH